MYQSKCFFIGLILFLLSKTTPAQTDISDLKTALNKSKSDTQQLHILNQLVENIDEDSLWMPYNLQMGKLAKTLIQSTQTTIKQVAKKYYGTYFNNLGYAAENKGNTPIALDCYYQALKLHEEAGDLTGVSTVLNNIGYLKNSQHDKASALQHFKHSLQIQYQIKDSAGMALSLLNIGSIYDDVSKSDSALNYYQQSVGISKAINSQQTEAIALSNMGSYFDKNQMPDSAKFYYTQAINIQQQIHDMEGIATSQINFGNLYLKEKNYALAQQHFEYAFSIANQTGYIKLKRGAALWLSKVYALQHNYKDAYQMHVLHKQLADSVSNAETRKAAVKKQMQYEYDKKTAVATALHEKQTLIAKTEIEKQHQIKKIILIAAILLLLILGFGFYNFYTRRKETFLKTIAQVNNQALRAQMNPHFIFNSLNSIQDFINHHDIPNANTYIVKFAKLVRLILENSRHQEVLLSDDLNALEWYMQLENLRLPHGFDYEINVDKNIDRDNTLLPPLILQPFVENAIWHGLQPKNQRGKITITISQSNGQLQCMVEDNGIGRKAAMQKKTTHMQQQNKSLGMEITRQRIKLYNSLKNAKAYFNIVDMMDAQQISAGMRVQLFLPFEEAN